MDEARGRDDVYSKQSSCCQVVLGRLADGGEQVGRLIDEGIGHGITSQDPALEDPCDGGSKLIIVLHAGYKQKVID